MWANDYRAVFHLEESAAGVGNAGVYIDSTGNGHDGIDDIAATGKSGRFGAGQEFDETNTDHIEIPIAALDGQTNTTVSWWYQSSNTGTSHTFLSGANSGQANEVIYWMLNNTTFEFFENGDRYPVTINSIADGNWNNMVAVRDDSNNQFRYYVNGAQDNESPQSAAMTAINLDPGGLLIGQEQDGVGGGFQPGQELDGFLDEYRVSGVVRSPEWIDAEYTNMNSPEVFYATSSSEVVTPQTRVFTETNATITGDVFINAGQVTLPSGTLALGGSLDNDGVIIANNGTIDFDSDADSETISFGASSPHNVRFVEALGEWTIIDSATTTGSVSIVDGTSWTLQSGESLYVGNQFFNSLGGAATTWTNTNLVIGTTTDYAINQKADNGDSYEQITLGGDLDISVWNSDYGNVVTDNTASLYSQDHAGSDGELQIYGFYNRDSGVEYWNYATDFDGVDLSGGNERVVNVSFDAGASAVFASSSLEVLGATGSETNITALSGNYDITLRNGTTTWSAAVISNMATSGVSLLENTNLIELTDTEFNVTLADASAITVDGDTIDNNPTAEYSGITFATSSAISAANVTVTGAPNSFWRFTSHSGNLAGETYDVDSGNPGSIQWDDSTFSTVVAGFVYAEDGVTPLGAPTCDGRSPVVTVVVDGVVAGSAPCDPVTGAYSVSGVTYTGNVEIMSFLDRDNIASAESSVTIAGIERGSGVVIGGDTFTVQRPAVSNGDMLIMMAGKDDEFTISAPAGWTLIDEAAPTNGGGRFAGAWYKTVTNADKEPTSYVFSSNDASNEGYSYTILSLSGVDLGDPFDTAATWSFIENSASPSAPSVTTVTDGSLVLAALFVDNDPDVTMPGGVWSTEFEDEVSPTDAINLSLASRAMPSAGASTNATLTALDGSDDTLAIQIAVKPATPIAGTTTAAVVSKTPITEANPLVSSEVTVRAEQSGTVDVDAGLTFDVTAPAMITEDVLVAIIGKDDDLDGTIVPPAGWVEIDLQSSASGNDMTAGAWYKVITDAGSEPLAYAFQSTDTNIEDFAWWIGSFDNVNTSNPLVETSGWQYQENEVAPIASAVTTLRNDNYVVASWFVINDTDVTMPGAPWTTLENNLTNNGRNLNVAGRLLSDPGSSGDVSITGVGGGNDTFTIQFALRSAGKTMKIFQT